MIIYCFGPCLHAGLDSIINLFLKILQRQDRRIVDSRKGLSILCSLLEEGHDFLEVILSEVRATLLDFGVDLGESDFILLIHAVQDATAILHSRGRPDVGCRLLKSLWIQCIIWDGAINSRRCRDVGILHTFCSWPSLGSIDGGYQVIFLSVSGQ